MRARNDCRRRKIDRRDQLIVLQIGVNLRRIAWQAVKIDDRDSAPPAWPFDLDDGVERGEGYRHVAGIHGDAGLALAEHRMNAIVTADRRATAARLALVAWERRVVEVIATRPLHEIAAGRGHVAQLRTCSLEYGLRQHRITGDDRAIRGEVTVANQCADAQAAARERLDPGQRQARDIYQRVRTLHAVLHKIDQIGTTPQKARRRVSRMLADCFGDGPGALVDERIHVVLRGVFARASSIAAQIPG